MFSLIPESKFPTIRDIIIYYFHFDRACQLVAAENIGTLYSFGHNGEGQLGLGHNNDVSLPTPIPNLPKISLISCGGEFAVCVDCEGFMWSFGENSFGQLGIGNKTSFNFNVPQKIEDIPPVLSVSCGGIHTLIISDSSLWSWGGNDNGQLCLGNKENHLKPQKTSFSNISKISTGSDHSLFQNDKGEIFSCGLNKYGACGLGHFDSPQVVPRLILNLPSNIVQFVCGSHFCLFLDSEGNVYSVGDNECGQLGLGHNTDLNVLEMVNIPPIQTISCLSASSYLIDFEGNLWNFGINDINQLEHSDNDKKNINAPKEVIALKDIQQISYGCCGDHFFAKNSQNQIFAAGYNDYGQLGTGDTESVSILKELNSQYSNIWRDEFHSRAKSARK